MATDLAEPTICALATPELMVNQLGLSLTVREELAQRMLLGSERCRMQMMPTLRLNVQIRAFVIERQGNASAFPTTKALPVKELPAQIAAVIRESVTLKISSPVKPVVPTILLGMLIKKLVAFVILDEEVLIAH
eukprot:CAMPEP_0202971162 /NCGR_PEP_ID=MMETSP1396-20130829/24638_1 /ASSEMBLY_ACC=CAM_ASM_000872 /TAXON_ID= /ORGANISM="Pseudokeronopsis sp., Strain Brazil" /LENGTH=133 /DNA_ID=CAMNT_0049700271 /DNA_START=149 /DNA_END=550 /DNA_ORIENTATION=-